MSALDIGRRPGWLPAGVRPRINWQHPLAQNLVFCMVDGYDLLSNYRLSITSTAFTPYGTGVRGVGANADTTALDFATGTTFSAMTAGFFTLNTSGTTAFSRQAYTSETVNSGWGLVRAASSFRWDTFNNNGAGAYRLSAPASSTTTGMYVAVGTLVPATRKNLYVYPNHEVSVTGAGLNVSTTSGGLTVMDTTNGSAVINAAWRDRELTKAEAFMMIADPFCFLTYPTNLARAAYAAAVAPPAPSTSEWDLSVGGGIDPGGHVFPSRHLHLVS